MSVALNLKSVARDTDPNVQANFNEIKAAWAALNSKLDSMDTTVAALNSAVLKSQTATATSIGPTVVELPFLLTDETNGKKSRAVLSDGALYWRDL